MTQKQQSVATLAQGGYRKRLLDDRIDAMLKTFGAVSIEGPRYCGKTWTAESHAESEIKVADSPGAISNRDLVSADPRIVLKGGEPRLIDEWQEVPAIWDMVRTEVDTFRRKGRLILTSSIAPRRDEYVHSGAGRIGAVKMRTMSLYESGDSDGSVSLASLFDGWSGMKECGPASLERLIDLAVRGGWPGSLGTDGDPKLSAIGHLNRLTADAAGLDGKHRSEEKMAMLLRSLARNECTLASDRSVRSGMLENDNETMAIETYYDYMDCLRRVHAIDDIPSYSLKLRSDARIGKASKRHLSDVSMAIAALNLDKELLMKDLSAFRPMFESLCLHDIRLYIEHNGGRMFHYRDGRGREIDAVVEARDGRWGAIEVKLGTGQIDAAAENLLKLNDFFTKEGKPVSFLCVVCGMAVYAYRRPDGVYVVPITSLGP